MALIWAWCFQFKRFSYDCITVKLRSKCLFLTVLLQKPKMMVWILKAKKKTDSLSQLCVNSARVIQKQQSRALWFNLSFASLETIQHQLLRKRKVSSLCSSSAFCCPRPSKSLLTSLSLFSSEACFFLLFLYFWYLCETPPPPTYRAIQISLWPQHLASALKNPVEIQLLYPRVFAFPLNLAQKVSETS